MLQIENLIKPSGAMDTLRNTMHQFAQHIFSERCLQTATPAAYANAFNFDDNRWDGVLRNACHCTSFNLHSD